MPLSPIDVQQQTFKVALRGYAEDEVDEFLDEVVISLRDYEQRLRDAEERIAVLEEQLSANRETEDAMRRTFLAAQRTADAIVEDAKVEADRLVTGAHSESDRVLSKAQSESDRLLSEARSESDRVSKQQGEEKAKLLGETALLRDRVNGLRTMLADLAADATRRLDDADVEAVTERIVSSVSPVADLRRIEGDDDLESLANGLDGEHFDEPAEAAGDKSRPWDDVSEDDDLIEEADDEDDDHEDDADDEPEVTIATVPDWMTARDETISQDPKPEYKRPWERSDG